MGQARFVEGVGGVGGARQGVQQMGPVERLQRMSQRSERPVLHRVEEPAVLLTGVEELDDVGTADGRESLQLAGETPKGVVTATVHQLDGDPLGVGQIQLASHVIVDPLDQTVVGERRQWFVYHRIEPPRYRQRMSTTLIGPMANSHIRNHVM